MMMLGAFALLLPTAVAPVEKEAQAIVSPVAWITWADYPRIAIEAGEQGTTGIRFVVAKDGAIRTCTVERSSGSPVLDATTCALVRQRGRFTPAQDLQGKPVEQTRTLRFTWRLPEDGDEAGADAPASIAAGGAPELKPFAIVVEMDVDGEGTVTRCRTTVSTGAAPDTSPFCDQAYANPMPVAGGSGAKAHKRKLIFRSSVSVEEMEPPTEAEKPRRSWREPA